MSEDILPCHTGPHHNGQCRCRAVRLTASGPPSLVANCHCKSCRKATGAAFATFADYDRARVQIDGPVSAYQSSPGIERLFCGVCGSPVAYSEANAQEINIHIGVFGDAHLFKPTKDCNQENQLWR